MVYSMALIAVEIIFIKVFYFDKDIGTLRQAQDKLKQEYGLIQARTFRS